MSENSQCPKKHESSDLGIKSITNTTFKSHFFHFICHLLTEPWAEQMRKYDLENQTGKWLLKFTSGQYHIPPPPKRANVDKQIFHLS
jgi:hypothetical protein